MAPRIARLNARSGEIPKGHAALFSQPDWYTFNPPSGTFCLRR